MLLIELPKREIRDLMRGIPHVRIRLGATFRPRRPLDREIFVVLDVILAAERSGRKNSQ
jgi:hypothetical protein